MKEKVTIELPSIQSTKVEYDENSMHWYEKRISKDPRHLDGLIIIPDEKNMDKLLKALCLNENFSLRHKAPEKNRQFPERSIWTIWEDSKCVSSFIFPRLLFIPTLLVP